MTDAHIRDLQCFCRNTSMPFRTRTPDQITTLFTDYHLIPAGVVGVSDWRPGPGPDPNRAPHDAFIGALGHHT